MRAEWIKMRTHLSSAPVAQRLGALCKGGPQHAVGVLNDFWSSVADHAKNGFIRDTDARTLEKWAGWEGKRGAFASWVRTYHMDADGRVNDWDEYMGAIEAQRTSDAARKRLERLQKSQGPSNGQSRALSKDGPITEGEGEVEEQEKLRTTDNRAREVTPGEVAFLEEVPEGRRHAWRAVIDSWYNGNYPQGHAADPRDVSAGLLDYIADTTHARDFKPKHVRAYVVGAQVQRLSGDRPRGRAGRKSQADETYDNALAGALAVQRLAKEKQAR